MKKIIVTKEHHGKKIHDYLKETEGFSGRGLRRMQIFINKKELKSADKLIKENDIITIRENLKGTDIEPIEMELKIVHEDNNLILINKPPYLITHPTAKKVDKTLANGIVYYLQQQGNQSVPRFYNRLDMNTSGIIVVAKNGYSQAFLQNYGEIDKHYIAVVDGIMEKDEYIIEKKIGISADGIKREISEAGQEAKTGVKVLKRVEKENITVIEVKLYTGRTHQIRVHLSSEGHPILGDELYGKKDKRAERQLLHSYKISYIDPESKKRVEYQTDLPEDMHKFYNF